MIGDFIRHLKIRENLHCNTTFSLIQFKPPFSAYVGGGGRLWLFCGSRWRFIFACGQYGSFTVSAHICCLSCGSLFRSSTNQSINQSINQSLFIRAPESWPENWSTYSVARRNN